MSRTFFFPSSLSHPFLPPSLLPPKNSEDEEAVAASKAAAEEDRRRKSVAAAMAWQAAQDEKELQSPANTMMVNGSSSGGKGERVPGEAFRRVDDVYWGGQIKDDRLKDNSCK